MAADPEEPAPEGERPADLGSTFLYQVYFRPLFAAPDKIRELFVSEGFPTLHSIKIMDHCGFARFPTMTDAQLFADHFNGFTTGAVTLFAELSAKKVWTTPPSRRVFLTGFDAGSLTEREIWKIASPMGFLRRIFIHSDYTLLDFDTVQDAEMAIEGLNKTVFRGKLFLAQFGKPPPYADVPKLTIPLTDILPPEHEFWNELAEKLRSGH
jgi:hypothetical protein